MKDDTQIFYEIDYDFNHVLDNKIDSSILVTNKESLRILNDQITEILNKSDDERIHQIKYPELQDPEEVPFHFIRLQDEPDDDDDDDEEDDEESLGMGCWVTIIILTIIAILILGFALIGVKQIL